MSTGDKFVSIQPKRLMGFLDFRDRFLDYIKAQLQDIVEVAYGDDGTVGGTITMTEFGSGQNRFQLDNDITGSDGQGHFLKTNLELSGRDIGLRFENQLGQNYRVALHYTERPRGIQVNPRTGFPEFLEFEETIGHRAEPDLVTDNGGINITFRVNSVARLFPADAALDQTGRRCLVWKKTPGKTAITEALAVELCTISLSSGHNVITTTGTFGQTVVSTNVSDYFVLLLGPTVSKHLLGSEPGYHFIGTVGGTGSGNAPTFDLTGQNNIGPLLSDINVISQLHHGNRKLRVQADNLDVDETQLEIRGRPDLLFPLVMSVDEDGDTYIGGVLDVDGATTIDDSLAVTGQAQFDSNVTMGDNDADVHVMKGAFTHRDTANNIRYERDGATGQTGIGGPRVVGKYLKSWGNTTIGDQPSAGSHVHELFGELEFKNSSGVEKVSISSQFGKLHVGGDSAIAPYGFKVSGGFRSDLASSMDIGSEANVGTAFQASRAARIDFGDMNVLAALNQLLQATGFAGEFVSPTVRCFVHSNGEGGWITINANYDGDTSQFFKDINGSIALGIEFWGGFGTQGALRIHTHNPANNAAWSAWNNILLDWDLDTKIITTGTGIMDLDMTMNLDGQLILGTGGDIMIMQGPVGIGSILQIGGTANSYWKNQSPGAVLEIDGNISSMNGAIDAQTGITSQTGAIAALGGNVTASLKCIGGTGIDATTGDVRAVAGNVAALGGYVTANTFMDAGTYVEAGTEHRYATPKTRYHWMAGASGIVTPDYGSAFTMTGPQAFPARMRLDESTGGFPEVFYDIHLPNGVALTSIDILYTAGGAGHALLAVYKVSNSGTNTALRSTANLSLPANALPNLVNYNSSPFLAETIDNENFRYFARITYFTVSNVVDIYGIRFQYDITNLSD